MLFALSLAWGFCFGKRRIAMSSYYELKWHDEDLSKYSTDKLYFIWNVVKQPLRPEYRQMLGELKWRQAKKKQTNTLAKIKEIISLRTYRNELRKAWLKLHPQAKKERTGKTISELAQMLPEISKQLGAFIELENIEIKYFGSDGEPYYELTDFRDVFPNNYLKSGFKKYGIAEKKFLQLIGKAHQEQYRKLRQQIELEEDENGEIIIPYYDAVELKHILEEAG